MSRPKIVKITNGPFVVKGVRKLLSQSGSSIEADEEYRLCRCGSSLSKPFCDGMHEIFEFSEVKDPNHKPDIVDAYKGNEITIYWNMGVCSHRGICYGELSEVWKMTKDEPVDPNGADVEAIIDICKRCPSGSLSFSLPGAERDLSSYIVEPQIKLANRRYGYDGPYEVAGGIDFEDDEGNKPETTEHYVLCRCGKSRNMPFCSGDHWAAKFIDENSDEEGEA